MFVVHHISLWFSFSSEFWEGLFFSLTFFIGSRVSFKSAQVFIYFPFLHTGFPSSVASTPFQFHQRTCFFMALTFIFVPCASVHHDSHLYRAFPFIIHLHEIPSIPDDMFSLPQNIFSVKYWLVISVWKCCLLITTGGWMGSISNKTLQNHGQALRFLFGHAFCIPYTPS